MNKITVIAFIFFIPFLSALEVDSTQMEYKGKTLTLKGQVTIEHDMGLVTASEAHLIPGKEGFKNKDLTLELKGDVTVKLLNGGVLRCAIARLGYSDLRGVFYPAEGEKVLYSDSEPPFTIETDLMTLQLQRLPDNTKTVSKIETNGQTHLSYTDSKEEKVHMLKGKGTCVVDHLKKVITFNQDESNEQIHFEDPYGEIQADKLTLSYAPESGKWALKQLLLEGHVALLNRYLAATLSSETKQYALADRVEMDPSRHNITLSSESPNRVVFMDPGNHLQVSAPGLILHRDPATQKDTIEGKGDVRFQLMNQEFDNLKKRFQIVPEENQ